MRSHVDVYEEQVFALSRIRELCNHVDFLISTVVMSQKFPLRISGKNLRYFDPCEISIISRENAGNANLGKFVGAAGRGLLKPPAIFWLKNRCAVTNPSPSKINPACTKPRRGHKPMKTGAYMDNRLFNRFSLFGGLKQSLA